jgi:hypothetical protein
MRLAFVAPSQSIDAEASSAAAIFAGFCMQNDPVRCGISLGVGKIRQGFLMPLGTAATARNQVCAVSPQLDLSGFC